MHAISKDLSSFESNGLRLTYPGRVLLAVLCVLGLSFEGITSICSEVDVDMMGNTLSAWIRFIFTFTFCMACKNILVGALVHAGVFLAEVVVGISHQQRLAPRGRGRRRGGAGQDAGRRPDLPTSAHPAAGGYINLLLGGGAAAGAPAVAAEGKWDVCERVRLVAARRGRVARRHHRRIASRCRRQDKHPDGQQVPDHPPVPAARLLAADRARRRGEHRTPARVDRGRPGPRLHGPGDGLAGGHEGHRRARHDALRPALRRR